jgi:MFS family permease
VYSLGLLTLAWFTPRPGAHGHAEEETGGAHRREYPQLLQSSRWLLLASYVLNSAMSPLLPFLIARAGVGDEWATPVAAIWTAARVVIVAIMWKAGFWHGRWGTLLAGGAGMAIGFTLIVASSSLAMLCAGLILLGSGMAITYYATLYYAMTVGHAEVEASGAFEALIGLGYTIGPIAGLIGVAASESFERTALGPDGGVVIVMMMLMLLASILALRPYMAARSARRHAAMRRT